MEAVYSSETSAFVVTTHKIMLFIYGRGNLKSGIILTLLRVRQWYGELQKEWVINCTIDATY
jgi:hypothetical protein